MNSNLTRKRSPSTYSSSKRTKFTTMPEMETSTTPQKESIIMSPSDETGSSIPENDWLTTICQSLGEVPALNETSDGTLIINMQESGPTDSKDLPPTDSQSLSNGALQNRIAGPGIETESSTNTQHRSVDEVTTRKSSEVLHEWNLDDGLVVSLHRSEWKLHIHIRKNSQHIVMTVPTYCDFKNQLATIGKPFERPSIICNNQLAVFTFPDDKTILQQIFRFEHFKLKNHSLELNPLDESRLQYAFKHIDDAIKVAIFESVLPKQLPKMSHKMSSMNELDLLREFMLAVNEEIVQHVKALFVCYGCKLSSPGQLSHDCITVDYVDQFSIVGEDSILLINPQRIANVLRDRNISQHFNVDFFNTNTYDIIRSLMPM